MSPPGAAAFTAAPRGAPISAGLNESERVRPSGRRDSLRRCLRRCLHAFDPSDAPRQNSHAVSEPSEPPAEPGVHRCNLLAKPGGPESDEICGRGCNRVTPIE